MAKTFNPAAFAKAQASVFSLPNAAGGKRRLKPTKGKKQMLIPSKSSSSSNPYKKGSPNNPTPVNASNLPKGSVIR
jgi:hypothetical protein